MSEEDACGVSGESKLSSSSSNVSYMPNQGIRGNWRNHSQASSLHAAAASLLLMIPSHSLLR